MVFGMAGGLETTILIHTLNIQTAPGFSLGILIQLTCMTPPRKESSSKGHRSPYFRSQGPSHSFTAIAEDGHWSDRCPIVDVISRLHSLLMRTL
jgi:hypothetical protein